MKVIFGEVTSIKVVWPHARPEIAVEGHMSTGEMLDVMASIWEYVGDEALIEHMRLEGFSVARIENKQVTT